MVARLGCEAVQLDVPMRVDLKFGRTWGDATHSWAELHVETVPTPKSITAPPANRTNRDDYGSARYQQQAHGDPSTGHRLSTIGTAD